MARCPRCGKRLLFYSKEWEWRSFYIQLHKCPKCNKTSRTYYCRGKRTHTIPAPSFDKSSLHIRSYVLSPTDELGRIGAEFLALLLGGFYYLNNVLRGRRIRGLQKRLRTDQKVGSSGFALEGTSADFCKPTAELGTQKLMREKIRIPARYVEMLDHVTGDLWFLRIVLISWLACSAFVIILVERIDLITRGELYSLGLQSSFEWTKLYWISLSLIRVFLLFPSILSAAILGLDFWKSSRSSQVYTVPRFQEKTLETTSTDPCRLLYKSSHTSNSRLERHRLVKNPQSKAKLSRAHANKKRLSAILDAPNSVKATEQLEPSCD